MLAKRDPVAIVQFLRVFVNPHAVGLLATWRFPLKKSSVFHFKRLQDVVVTTSEI